MTTQASTFVTHFARLVSQRVHEPHNLDAHRAALTDALAANDDAVTLVWDNWQIRAGSDVVSSDAPPVLDLVSRMAAHGVRELSFGAKTELAHLVGAAWVLSQEPVIGDGGALAASRLSTVGASTVRMVTVVPQPIVTLAQPSEPAEPPMEEPQPPQARGVITLFTERRFEQRETADVLIAHLSAAQTLEQTARALDALAAFTELPRKRIADVATILTTLIAQEPRWTHESAKRMFRFSLKRIAKSSTFRAMAAALVQMPEKRDEYVRIFKYFGDAAADQVIEQLAHADSLTERRILYDTLVELRRGVPTLISLLGDGRWYVVRNAAELLGEMRAVEAEQGLSWLVNHPDARVRRSATAALVKLDTPGARAALSEASKDVSPDVRMNALLGLSNGDKKGVATQIIRALPDERNPDTQQTLMIILGRLGTPEAIRYLVNAAEPERSFFRRKPTPTRVAAIAALADASDPEAVEAIRAMVKDKERDVRAAAVKALTPAKAKAAW